MCGITEKQAYQNIQAIKEILLISGLLPREVVLRMSPSLALEIARTPEDQEG